jgi:hypothetical protein
MEVCKAVLKIRARWPLCRPFQTHKRNILVAQASSAFKHSLKELFAAPGLAVEIKVRVLCLNEQSEVNQLMTI